MGTISAIVTFLSDLWALCKDNASAIGLMILNYEEYKIDRERRAKEALELQLKFKQNQEAVDAKYRDKSDLDVVRESIIDGGGAATDIEADGDSPAGSTAAGDRGGLEQADTQAVKKDDSKKD